jgi:DNA-binding transcriptional ArsR family regulator
MSEAKKGGGARLGKPQVRLSHITFALLLEEFMSGPCTAKHLAEHTGMGHRSMCTLIRTLKAKKLVHIGAWEKDSIGRIAVPVYALGTSADARRPRKTREQINRDYRTRANREPMKGTPFFGLGAMG